MKGEKKLKPSEKEEQRVYTCSYPIRASRRTVLGCGICETYHGVDSEQRYQRRNDLVFEHRVESGTLKSIAGV